MPTKENKMGVLPIPKLLISMSLPMMLSMLVQSLYNIVDSLFVSRIDEYALTAVSLAFPVQNLMIAVGSGTCVGVNALLSRSLGQKDRKSASRYAINGIFLSVCSYIVFALLGTFFSRLYFTIQTDNEMIINYGTEYLSIVTMASLGIFLQFAFERILQATGMTLYTMITQSLGAITNIILDPIMIFGLCGCPKMGIAGAAIATVIGQIFAMLLAFFFNMTRNKEISLSTKGFRPSLKAIKEIYKIGVPSIIMVSIGSIMNFCMNKILLMFTSTAAAVFGVYFKLNSFVFMPIFGLNNGMIPIIAYNYGAKSKERILQTIKLAKIIAFAIMCFGTLVFLVLPAPLLKLFNASETMLQIGIPALRIICLSFPLAAICIVTGSVFQAFGDSIFSMWVSVARQLIVLVPVAWLFARLFGLNAVWWSYNIAEIVSFLMTMFFQKKCYRKRLSEL